jgi:hypothetical protein
MTPAQVAAFSERIDLDALREYLTAMRERSEIVAASLDDGWTERIPVERAERCVSEFIPPEGRDYVRPFWVGASAGWALWWVNVIHPNLHIGQAIVTRDIVQRRG